MSVCAERMQNSILDDRFDAKRWRFPQPAFCRPQVFILKNFRPIYYLKKLLIRLSVIKCQPSTNTNKSNLNGSEISTGGNIIMPMLINTVLITTSIIRNGRYTLNPMMKAVLSSLSMNAGISVVVLTSDQVCGRAAPV